MSDSSSVKTLRGSGRRPNKAAEPSLFLPHEDTLVETEQKASEKAVRGKKSARALAVIGAALVWLPILVSAAYTIVLLAKQTRYAGYYGIVILSLFWLVYIVGGVLLCVSAHKLKHLRRSTLTALIVWLAAQGGSALLASLYGSAANYVSQATHKWVAVAVTYGLTGAWYLCLLAFAVFAVLLLVRAFSKKNAG